MNPKNFRNHKSGYSARSKMSQEPKHYPLNNTPTLRNCLKDSLLHCLANDYKFYRSRALEIAIGLAKIIEAAVLMSIYLWHASWDKKLFPVIFFVFLTLVTYGIQYGLGLIWWPHYIGTFTSTKYRNINLVVCLYSPFASGEIKLKIYQMPSTSYLQKLPAKPKAEFEGKFSDFFTVSGYFMESKWKDQIKPLMKVCAYH